MIYAISEVAGKQELSQVVSGNAKGHNLVGGTFGNTENNYVCRCALTPESALRRWMPRQVCPTAKRHMHKVSHCGIRQQWQKTKCPTISYGISAEHTSTRSGEAKMSVYTNMDWPLGYTRNTERHKTVHPACRLLGKKEPGKGPVCLCAGKKKLEG